MPVSPSERQTQKELLEKDDSGLILNEQVNNLIDQLPPHLVTSIDEPRSLSDGIETALLEQAVSIIRSAIKSDYLTVSFFNPDGETSRIYGFSGRTKIDETSIPIDPFVRRIRAEQRTVYVSNVTHSPDLMEYIQKEKRKIEYFSLICTPIVADETSIGVILIQRQKPDGFDEPHEMLRMTDFGRLIAATFLRLIKNPEELKKLQTSFIFGLYGDKKRGLLHSFLAALGFRD